MKIHYQNFTSGHLLLSIPRNAVICFLVTHKAFKTLLLNSIQFCYSYSIRKIL